jgi:hypothetical protein
MKKLDLKTYMGKPEFEKVSSPPKLADRIGEITGERPTDVTVWGWVNKGRKPCNKKWLKALAGVFKVQFGEQFFLS